MFRLDERYWLDAQIAPCGTGKNRLDIPIYCSGVQYNAIEGGNSLNFQANPIKKWLLNSVRLQVKPLRKLDAIESVNFFGGLQFFNSLLVGRIVVRAIILMQFGCGCISGCQVLSGVVRCCQELAGGHAVVFMGCVVLIAG